LTMEIDVDSVCSWFLDLIDDRVSTIVIILNFGIDILGTRDLDFERITSFPDRIAVAIDRVDGEGERVLGLSMGQTVTFGI